MPLEICRYFNEVMSRFLRTEIEILRIMTKVLISLLIPQSTSVRNIYFFTWCTYSMFTDPFFLYTPVIKDDKMCFKLDNSLKYGVIAVRSIMDFLFLINSVSEMIHEFRQDSRVSSVLEMMHEFRQDSRVSSVLEMMHEFRQYASWSPFLIFLIEMVSPLLIFLIDLSIVLPLPQVLVILAATQRMRGRKFFFAMIFFLVQHVLKIIRFCTLVEKAKTTNKLTKWAKVTFNLSFCHAAHIIGATYYFFALQRKTVCWRKACTSQAGCDRVPFYCDNKLGNYTFSNDFCSTNTRNNLTTYDFGIFKDAIQFGVVEETNFFKRFFASFRWSLQILSSFGQGLPLSTDIWENIFVMCITITGVVLFFFLIAKVQSEMSKSEETRHEIEEIDRWQPFAKLRQILQYQVKKHQSSFKWRETYRGVDVESLLNNLPEDLIKNIKQELCLDLLKNYCRDYRVMAEHEEMNLPDLEGRPSRRKQTKKKDLQKDGDKIVVEYNIYGVPIGQGRNEMRNYIGVIVRETISITYDDWRRVPLEVKEFLWQHFQKKFALSLKMKGQVLKLMRVSLRNFRSELANEFIIPNKNDMKSLRSPPIEYPSIKDGDWKLFVNKVLSAEFQVKSQQAKEKRAKNTYNHHLGSTGYSGMLYRHKLKTGTSENEIDRSDAWIMVRKDKDGNLQPAVAAIEMKISDLKSQVEEGSFHSQGPKDILTEAIQKQPNGSRVQGIGQFITPSMYFQIPESSEFAMERKKYQESFQFMTAQLEYMNARLNAYSNTEVGSSNFPKAKSSSGACLELERSPSIL